MHGFTTVELLISMAIMGIMVGATLLQMSPVIQQWRANRAMELVVSQLRWARQSSIAERRNIQVQFIGSDEIKLTRQDVPAGQTVVSDLFLGGGVQFMLVRDAGYAGCVGDTAPIYFNAIAGGPPVMQFQSDGTLVDGNGNPINGTVFLGISNYQSTARAVTVLGATGRACAFRGTGQGWIR
jgi:Tfp pilus assembly protein FimT